MRLEEFCRTPGDYTVALLGFGRANRAVLAWLGTTGGTATVYTEQPLPPELAAECEATNTPVLVGKFPASFGEQVLVRSPGIRPDILPIESSVASGALLTSETELFMALTPAFTIGVTGSDGKTTTASLTAALLRASGHRVWLGGNNGTPLLPFVGQMQAGDMAVLELSSFQLMTMERTPSVAVITNIAPNHLNWHTDMAEYITAKSRIFGSHTKLILNAENAITRNMGMERENRVVFFSPHPSADRIVGRGMAYASGNDVVVCQDDSCRAFDCLSHFLLPGRHNLENLLAAMAATAPFLTNEAPAVALSSFRGVSHRLQYVGTVRGVRYYNSSIDTSPTRTVAALEALGGHPLVIAGGRGKGVSFLPLGAAFKEHAKAVYLYGEAAHEIAAALPAGVAHKVFDRFAQAFVAAASDAREGDTVLLSPGCTAFGEFRDFEQRGEVFCRLVEELAKERK